MKLILIVGLLILSACNGNFERREYVGLIKKANIIQKTFGGESMTTIETDIAIIVVYGHRSVRLNDSAFIQHMDNGKKYWCVQSDSVCWRVK